MKGKSEKLINFQNFTGRNGKRGKVSYTISITKTGHTE